MCPPSGHKRGVTTFKVPKCGSTLCHVLWHTNLQRKLLCQSSLLHEFFLTRAIGRLAKTRFVE